MEISFDSLQAAAGGSVPRLVLALQEKLVDLHAVGGTLMQKDIKRYEKTEGQEADGLGHCSSNWW